MPSSAAVGRPVCIRGNNAEVLRLSFDGSPLMSALTLTGLVPEPTVC